MDADGHVRWMWMDERRDSEVFTTILISYRPDTHASLALGSRGLGTTLPGTLASGTAEGCARAGPVKVSRAAGSANRRQTNTRLDRSYYLLAEIVTARGRAARVSEQYAFSRKPHGDGSPRYCHSRHK